MLSNKCLTIALGLALVAGGALAQQKAIAIGTGGTGGVYYPLGGGLACRCHDRLQFVADVGQWQRDPNNRDRRIANGDGDVQHVDVQRGAIPA